MYIHLPTLQYPFSEEEIRQFNPDMHFPEPFTPPPEYLMVERSEIPPYDSTKEKLTEGDAIKGPDGIWRQSWTIKEKDSSQKGKSSPESNKLSKEIEALEKDSLRPLRELALGIDPESAIKKLKETQQKIMKLREERKAFPS